MEKKLKYKNNKRWCFMFRVKKFFICKITICSKTNALSKNENEIVMTRKNYFSILKKKLWVLQLKIKYWFGYWTLILAF